MTSSAEVIVVIGKGRSGMKSSAEIMVVIGKGRSGTISR